MAIPSPFLMQLPTEEMEVGDYSWAAPSGSEVMRASLDPAQESTAGHPDFAEEGETLVQLGDVVGRLPQNESATPHLSRISGAFRLTTAAELCATSIPAKACDAPLPDTRHQTPDTRQSTPDTHPDVFQHGMLVRHPQYGLGKILALSGAGVKRTATVAFAQGAGEKRFILVHSKLQPAKNGA
jgi:hypothetical protein